MENRINNLKQVKQLLNFTEKGDFYMLLILRRKKDMPIEERDNHQSVRIIKTYCIESIEHLEKRYDEIIQLCEMFKARAYIHVQGQNHKDVSLDMLATLAEKIKNGATNQKNLFDSVVGQIKTNEKRWIIDVDIKDLDFLNNIQEKLFDLKPVGEKVEMIIPTKNGYHLITSKFDVMTFRKMFPDTDIQKKNPTLLYYPNSLE